MTVRRWVSVYGAAALVAAPSLGAQQTVVIRCAEPPCDSLHSRLRLQARDVRFRLDSLLREMTEEPVGSPDRIRMDKVLMAALSEMADAMPLVTFETRTVTGGRGVVRIGGRMAGGSMGGRSMAAAMPKGWIGINMDAVPHQEFISDSGLVIRYFEHPAIISVDPDSPAERSGINRGDLLLSYNGADVTEGPINLTALLQPKQQVAVRVRRGGEVREFGVLIGKTPDGFVFQRDEPLGSSNALFFFPAPPDGVFQPALIGANGVLGALLSAVDAESGRAYGVQSGLLVNSAPEGTPARESGLRGGDVIVRAGGQPVASLMQFRAILRRHVAERELAVEVSRERKVVPLVLSWSAK